LGLATARALGRLGMTVIVGSRDAGRGEQAAATLRREGATAETVAIDVTDIATARAAAARIERLHGRLDVLVNNAGILPEATAADADRPLDAELVRRTLETNVFGAAAVTQAMLGLLRRSP